MRAAPLQLQVPMPRRHRHQHKVHTHERQLPLPPISPIHLVREISGLERNCGPGDSEPENAQDASGRVCDARRGRELGHAPALAAVLVRERAEVQRGERKLHRGAAPVRTKRVLVLSPSRTRSRAPVGARAWTGVGGARRRRDRGDGCARGLQLGRRRARERGGRGNCEAMWGLGAWKATEKYRAGVGCDVVALEDERACARTDLTTLCKLSQTVR